MTPARFRALALALKGAEEHSHLGTPDFRLPKKGRIFATLRPDGRQAMVKISLEQQAFLVDRYPTVFVLLGGWSKDGSTGVVLEGADEKLVKGLLAEAFALAAQKASPKRPKRKVAPRR